VGFAALYPPYEKATPMGLFKSDEERRIERDIKIRQGIRRIEKAIREQGKFQDDFVKNAQHAKKIGDKSQYVFIRNSLRKTATIRKMLERQLLSVKNALLIKKQAEASADFTKAMGTMATEIGRLFAHGHVPGQHRGHRRPGHRDGRHRCHQ
jgi:hypothetical protein